MILDLDEIREACKEYEKRYDDSLPPSTWLPALVEELTQARAEIEKLRAFVPSPELMQRLAALDEDYARGVDEAYQTYERRGHGD